MGAMTLRNLDPDVLEILRSRAREQGQSLNALICEILARAAEQDERRRRMREQRPRAERLRRATRSSHGPGTPSEKLVREDRRR